jgi:hypothetical protein
MSKYRKGMLYVRRIAPSDKSSSFVTAMQMAAKLMISRKLKRPLPVVLVRHGYRKMDIIDIGDNRAELLGRLNFGIEPFKSISRRWRDDRGETRAKVAASN